MKYLFALLLLATTAVPAAAQAERIGDVYLGQRPDPQTGETRLAVMVPADEMTDSRMIAIGWACTNEGIELGFSMGTMLGREETRVQVQFDQEPALEPASWTPGTNPRFTFLPDDQMADFSRRAMAADRLTLQVWDRGGEESTFHFSLAGLTRGLQRLPCAAGLLPDA